MSDFVGLSQVASKEKIALNHVTLRGTRVVGSQMLQRRRNLATSLETGDFFMPKKPMLALLLAVGMLASSIGIPSQTSAGVPEAVSYLQSQAPDAWVTQALVAAGVENPATAHLTSVSGNLATDYAKAILAVVAAGQNPSTFGNTDYVEELKDLHTDSQMGDRSLLNDDMWSIIALSSVDEADSAQAADAKTFLLNNQNTDGGWSWAVGAPSDTNDTAAAIMALLEVGLSATSTPLVAAMGYLQSVQNADGGMPYSVGGTSDAGSDAWVIAALNKFGIDETGWNKTGGNPASHLLSLQAEDGGYWWVAPGSSDFNNKAMTPFAVVALSGASYPVAYFSSEPEPTPGQHQLRIEGGSATICDAVVTGATALAAGENGAAVRGY